MTLTHTPGRGRPARSPIGVLLSAVLSRRVRGLTVEVREVREDRLHLRGRADSYHVNQLAQYAAMAMTELPLAANEFDVVPGSRRRVVLASGDDRIRAAGWARLTALGWEVATARCGLDCVAHLRRSAWDVAVLDADLLWGGADGVLADIADGASPDIPVVFLGNPPSMRAGGNAARVAAVLERPFDLDTLARVVADAAGGRVAAPEWR